MKPSPDDGRIIQMYHQRNPQAIRCSAHAYGSYCFAVANNILANTEDSEECVNDTWMRAWNAIPPQTPTVLRMFLAKITRRLAIDRLKIRTAQKRGSGEVTAVLDELAECIAAETDVEDTLIAQELADAVNRFLRALPKEECNLFLRRYFYTESVKQIAADNRISENYASVILSRTRKKLKQHLQDEGFL